MRKVQDAGEGLAAFPCMWQQRLKPNVITLTVVVSALERGMVSSPTDHLHRSGHCFGEGRMPERALHLFDEMRQQGLEPN